MNQAHYSSNDQHFLRLVWHKSTRMKNPVKTELTTVILSCETSEKCINFKC